MGISKKKRFDIFKRDNFQCQYCGNSPPNVILEPDHILSKKHKGLDDIDNLITACFDCNRGKSSEKLENIPDQVSDRLEKIKEKHEQLKEFYKFQKAIQKHREKDLELIEKKIREITDDSKIHFTSKGRLDITNLLKNFTRFEIEDAIEIAFAKDFLKGESRFKYMYGVLWRKKEGKNLNGKS